MTSLETEATPADHIDMMSFEAGAFHLLRTPRLAVSVNGAGDALAALFLFHRLRTGSAVAAMEAAGSSIYGLLRRTAEEGSREILTVAAQEEFVAPGQMFTAHALLMTARRKRSERDEAPMGRSGAISIEHRCRAGYK